MQKDLKIGLALGLVLVVSAVLWLATRPSLSPTARMSRIPKAAPVQQIIVPAEDVDTSNNESPSITPEEVPQESTEEVPMTAQYEQAEKIETQKFHIVLKGETLSGISIIHYGSSSKWKKIFDANRKTIKDPNKLKAGIKLIIPN